MKVYIVISRHYLTNVLSELVEVFEDKAKAKELVKDKNYKAYSHKYSVKTKTVIK